MNRQPEYQSKPGRKRRRNHSWVILTDKSDVCETCGCKRVTSIGPKGGRYHDYCGPDGVAVLICPPCVKPKTAGDETNNTGE